MNHAKWVLGIAMLFGIATAGCASRNYLVTRTGTGPVVSKAPDCDFAILTTRGERGYDEVAILEGDGQPAMTAVEFQKMVRKQVCELGGDAVLAEVDNQGAYLRGTVLVSKDAAPETAAGTEPAGEPPSAPEVGAVPAAASPPAAAP